METLILAGLIFIATFASEDLTALAAGLLAYEDSLPYWLAFLAAATGIYCGDLGIFTLGRYSGSLGEDSFLRRWFFPGEGLEHARLWFCKRGGLAILFSRFIPGSRVPLYFAAGALQMPFWKFASILLLAVILWVPLLFWMSSFFGLAVFNWFGEAKHPMVWAILAMILLLTGGRFVFVLSTHYRRRRLLLGYWLRIYRWEYWPVWALYWPVVLISVVAAIRYRSVNLYRRANPLMPDGGFSGESKGDILDALSRALPERSSIRVAKYLRISNRTPWEQLQKEIDSFQRGLSGAWPIVLKPDVGERGAGVRIVRDKPELETALRALDRPGILQEFIPGAEFGIFAERDLQVPTQFKVSSITRKADTVVIGNGEDSLEKRILGDPRAVAMARFFLETHANDLQRVPESGEKIRLNELGTHCRGSLFLEGMDLHSAKLERRLGELLENLPDFDLGRFDVKADSEWDLRKGNFVILELNGTTSEPSNMYDPKYGVLRAWRVLICQWWRIWKHGARRRAV